MKYSNLTLSVIAVALAAISISVLCLKKCNFKKETIHLEAGGQANQNDTMRTAARQPDHQLAPTPLPEEDADQHGYILEKVSAAAVADSDPIARLIGHFASVGPTPQTIGIVTKLGGYNSVSNVHFSPNEHQLLYFDEREFGWRIWSIQDGSPSKLVAEPPSEVAASQIFSWHWLNNDRLIGQYHAMFDPAIEGYANEGWTESTKLYIFDLKSLTTSSVGWPSSLTTKEKIFQIDPLSDGNTLTVPLRRYYSIHSVSDQGEIHLVSLDTTKPEGGNQRDEGWFILKQR